MNIEEGMTANYGRIKLFHKRLLKVRMVLSRFKIEHCVSDDR